MGISVKGADKKAFAQKTILDTIKTKYEEQRRQRNSNRNSKIPKYQYQYMFDDLDVVLDALRLVVLHVETNGQYNGLEQDKLLEFLYTFVPRFFNIDVTKVSERIGNISRSSPDEDDDDSIAAPTELVNGRGRRLHGKKTELRHRALDRVVNGTSRRGHKTSSAASGSRGSTPDLSFAADEEMGDISNRSHTASVNTETWLAVNPSPVAVQGTTPLHEDDANMHADQPFKRHYYSLYCNQSVFVFCYLFEIFYRRLKALKDTEEDVIEAVRRANRHKPAHDIGKIDKRNEDYFAPAEPGVKYYDRVLELIEDFIQNNIDEATFQDFLRRYYLRKGWALYSIQDLLKQLCRAAVSCSSTDAKDRTRDILAQYYTSRQSEEMSYNTEINLRKQTEKYLKDSEMFLIQYVSYYYCCELDIN